MKQRVLITGASGFVGYHLIISALDKGLEVYAAIRKSSKVDHLKDLNINYTYPDYTDLAALKKEFSQNKYTFIIHAAGVTTARSEAEYNQINADYTHNLALAAADSAVKKLVLISSLAAIGPLNTLKGIITENTPPNPLTAYGRSKLLAEERLRSVQGLNYTILRPTGVYGPRDKDIFIFFQQMARGIEPYISRFEQKLSLIYVTDVTAAAIKALYAGDNKAYNLSDGMYYDRYALGNITREVLNLRPIKFHLPVNFVKLIATLSEMFSSLSNKAAVLNREKLLELMAINWDCSIEQARIDLDFKPAYNLQSGVTEALNWYKANKWL